MSDTEDYRNNAEDCLRLGEADQDEQDKSLWATLAVSWLKLAEDADRIRSGRLGHPSHPVDLDALASTGDR